MTDTAPGGVDRGPDGGDTGIAGLGGPSAPSLDPSTFDALPGTVAEDPREPLRVRPIKPIREQRAAIDELRDAERPEKPAAEPQKPEKFKFGDIEFDSREAAEQNFKSLRGMHRAVEKKAEEAGGRASENARVAHAWKAEADRLRAEIEALRTGRPAAGGERPQNLGRPSNGQAQPTPAVARGGEGADPAAEAKAFRESIDWEFYHELYEQQGPQAAQWWLTDKFEAHLAEREGRLLKQIEQRFQPFQEQQARTQELHAAADVFERMASFKDQAGDAYYPELGDQAAVEAIARTWNQMGMPPDLKFSERGVHLAILEFRFWRDRQSGAADAGPGAHLQPSRDGGGQPAPRAAETPEPPVLTGSGTPRPAAAGEDQSTQLTRRIREAAPTYPGLGFSA